MKLHRILLLTVTLLIFCAPVLAQDEEYGRGERDANLVRLASQLAQQTSELAQRSYTDYTTRTTNSQSDTQGVFAAQQLNASANVFRTMVNDHRRRSELRDAGSLLVDLARSGNNYGTRGRWAGVQRTIDDIQSELSRGPRGGGGGIGSGSGGGEGYPVASGTVRWRGTVDNVVQLKIQGSNIDPQAISGTPYNDATYNFTSPLPNRPVIVQVRKIRGRGEVRIVQQPARSNDWTAVVEVSDGGRSADNYEVEITW